MTQDPDKDWLRGGWMQTYTGRKFYPANPTADMIDIRDIAHALSNICRFAGHTDEFYSVGQHSLNAEKQFPKDHKLAMEALLHDAAEAYLGDMPTPLKALIPEYKALEKKLDVVIREKFGLPPEMSPEVKAADMDLLLWELKHFMGPVPADVAPIYNVRLYGPVAPITLKRRVVEREFMQVYTFLRRRT